MRFVTIILLLLINSIAVDAQVNFARYQLAYNQELDSTKSVKTDKALRQHFLHGDGKDFEFSERMTDELAEVIVRRKLLTKKKCTFLRTEGEFHWYSMPTYPTKYSFIVGRIDIAFKIDEASNSFRIVGLEDIYDFNPKKMGGRPLLFELITRASINTFYRNGVPFRMFYRNYDL